MKEKKAGFVEYFSFSFLLLAVLFVLGYIWSDHFISEYDFDVAEMVLWAESVIDSGRLGNPDFVYSYFLPFGGHLLLIPFIKLFGPGLPAHRCGMTVWSLLLIAAIFLFFRCFFRSYSKSAFYSGIIVFCLSSVKRLRLLFWTHTIFYPLAVFFFLGTFILLYDYKQGSKNQNRTLILLFIWVMIGSSENITLMILFILPFLSAFIFEILLEKKLPGIIEKENLKFLVVFILAAAAGRCLYHFLARDVTTVYGDQYQFFSNEWNWFSNIQRTLVRWFNLFAELQEDLVSVYSPDGWFLSTRLVFALFVLFVSFFSFREYSKFNYLEKTFCCFHYFLAFTILFLYLFGKLSDTKWRLIPIYFTSIVMTILIGCRNFPKKLTEASVPQLLTLALLSVYAVVCGLSLVISPKDVTAYYGEDRIITILQRNGFEYGYTLCNNYGNTVRALTNGEIKSVHVGFDPEKRSFYPDPYNNSNKDYSKYITADNYFLIASEEYYMDHPQIADGSLSVIPVKGKDDSIIVSDQYPKDINMVIIVFDHDILESS